MPLSESVLEILFSGRDLLTELVEAAIGDQPSPTGVQEYIGKLDKFTSIYEQTAQVIEGRGGPEQSFEAAHAAEAPQAGPSDAEAFEAEVQRLLAEAAAKKQRAAQPRPSPRLKSPALPEPPRQSSAAQSRARPKPAPAPKAPPAAAAPAARRRTPSRSARRFIKRFASTSSAWMRCSISSANWSSTARASRTSRTRSNA